MPDVKSLEEMLKKGLLKKGSDPSLVVKKLPLGIIALDDLLGGGLPMGRCVHSYGPESTGKTLLTQYAIAAVQKSEYPLCLYMDMERSYDEVWWKQSGVDTEELLVSTPTTAEEAIDIIRATCLDPRLGMVVIDSVAAMIPKLEMDENRSTEENHSQPGAQAKAITRMFHQVVPLLQNRIILFTTNQMRENIGGHDELGALPGGRANRHYNHIILRTRREDWINDNATKKHIGFYMEIMSRKNKVSQVADGSSITLPFMLAGQFDWTTTYIDEAINKEFIKRRGPYYQYAGQNFLGMGNLRQFFTDNPEELEILKTNISL